MPIVFATELAAHGSDAAVADGAEDPVGTVNPNMAPPAAHTANAASKLRRAVT
jgi:hypothetical protein